MTLPQSSLCKIEVLTLWKLSVKLVIWIFFLTSFNHGNQFSDSFPKREVIIVHFDQKLFSTACCTNLNGIVKTQTNSSLGIWRTALFLDLMCIHYYSILLKHGCGSWQELLWHWESWQLFPCIPMFNCSGNTLLFVTDIFNY